MTEFVPEIEDTGTLESDVNKAIAELENNQQEEFNKEESRRLEEKKKREQKEKEEKEFIEKIKLTVERAVNNLANFRAVIWMDDDKYSGNFLQLRLQDKEGNVGIYVINPKINWPGVNNHISEISINGRITYEDALIINSRLKWINKNKIKPIVIRT